MAVNHVRTGSTAAIDAHEWPFISICIPVKNGGQRLGRCLQAIKEIDYPKDRLEIIIADGRSTDDTVKVAKSFGATVLDNPGEIVASGRNVAFAAARGSFIACTDDDCIVPRNWAKTALSLFDTVEVGAVGGISLLPPGAPTWAQAVNAVFRMASHAGYSVQSDHLADGDAADLPGGNAFYRAEAYHGVAPFDERLVTAEDVELHLRMQARGHRLKTSPALTVWHDKRPTPKGVFRQLRRFAEGRIQLARKFPRTLRPLHRLMGWGLPMAAALSAATCILASPLALAALALSAYLAVTVKARIDGERWPSALLVAPALAVMIAGWSLGYFKELLLPMPSTVGR